MHLFRTSSTVIATFASVIFTCQAQAATLTSKEQVNQVVEWFTGLFDNSEQASNEADVPFLTMNNCVVSPVEDMANPDVQYVHLEQYIGGTSLLRTSGYEFSPIASGVSLQVYTYSDRDAALGSCHQPNPTINLANLASPSCDLTLFYQSKRFFGTNSPTGCPSGFPVPGSTVVSTVEISAEAVVAFDQFFAPNLPPIGTEIVFEPVATTNEPNWAIVLVGLGIIALVKADRLI